MLEAPSNDAQIEYWNTAAGETWAQFQEVLDRQVEPLGLAAMDVLRPAEGEHIIDIGCGCGQTSLALAARVRPKGSVTGVDISEPMLDVALHRPRSADRSLSESWTHKPAISDMAFSTRLSLALA